VTVSTADTECRRERPVLIRGVCRGRDFEVFGEAAKADSEELANIGVTRCPIVGTCRRGADQHRPMRVDAPSGTPTGLSEVAVGAGVGASEVAVRIPALLDPAMDMADDDPDAAFLDLPRLGSRAATRRVTACLCWQRHGDCRHGNHGSDSRQGYLRSRSRPTDSPHSLRSPVANGFGGGHG